MESILGGENTGGGLLLRQGGEYCQAGDGTTLGEVPESCASGERLHLMDTNAPQFCLPVGCGARGTGHLKAARAA